MQTLCTHFRLSGLIDRNYEATPLLGAVGRINREITSLAPLLLDLEPDAQPIEIIRGDAIGRAHRDSAGRLILILAAKETQHPASLRLRLPGLEPVRIIDQREGESIPLTSIDGSAIFDLILGPGDGRVLLVE